MAKGRKKSDTVAFAEGVKSLRQEDRTWEVDFRALPKALMQAETQYLGLVINKENGSLLTKSQVDGRPRTSDIVDLITSAMQQPLIGNAHRPSRLHVRGRRQWEQVFPLLEELGISVSVRQELPKAKKEFEHHLEQIRNARRSEMVRPSKQQAAIEGMFPAVARWVQGYGHIEIGDEEGFGFTVRAIDYGGIVFEDDKAETLSEAMAALEYGLVEFFEREGIE